MAHKYLAASAAVGTSGSQTLGRRITISGSAAVNTVGTVELKTGGTGGTGVWKMFIDGGKCVQLELPSQLCFDFVTIANATVFVEYFKQHGV